MTATPAMRSAIEAAFIQVNEYARRKRPDVKLRSPDQIRKFANALLAIWEFSLRSDKAWVDQQTQTAIRDFREKSGGDVVIGAPPIRESGGTINALTELRELEQQLRELWRLNGCVCEEAADAIRQHNRGSSINDRLKELLSMAASAREALERTPPTPATRGPKTNHVALNVSDHLVREYLKLAGEPPTKDNYFRRLVWSVFEALGVEASADSCAKTAVERYTRESRSTIEFRLEGSVIRFETS